MSYMTSSNNNSAPDKRAREAFGRELSRIRRNAEITQQALARALGVSTSYISKLENGALAPTPRVLRNLEAELKTNGYLDHLWTELTGSGRQAWILEFQTEVKRATAVYDYKVLAFPGYLQEETYSRAMIRCGAPWLTPNEVEERVEERVTWTSAVSGATTPILWLVVDGAILQRRYAPAEVMHKQLSLVVDYAESGRLNLQLIPTDIAGHPGSGGSFTVLTGHGPEVVHVESVHSGQFITAPTDVAHYRMLFGALQGRAIGPEESLAAFRTEMKRLEHE